MNESSKTGRCQHVTNWLNLESLGSWPTSGELLIILEKIYRITPQISESSETGRCQHVTGWTLNHSDLDRLYIYVCPKASLPGTAANEENMGKEGRHEIEARQTAERRAAGHMECLIIFLRERKGLACSQTYYVASLLPPHMHRVLPSQATHCLLQLLPCLLIMTLKGCVHVYPSLVINPSRPCLPLLQ